VIARLPIRLVLGLLLAAGCSAQPGSHAHHGGPSAPPAGGAPVLFDNLGDYHRTITTTSRQAQAYFDQGLRLLYGFNHHEAQAAFREAARLDPACAMCVWGSALTYGSNYNSPTDAERERGAWAAVSRARTLAATRGTEPERALIAALAARHSAAPTADRAALDRAYADAMRDVTRRFPADLDAATLFADALMNLRPWSLWTPEGTPQPGTEEIVATLERVLADDPRHPGANHLYIHAVEASPDPRRAEAAADRLLALMPGAGHMVHMPSHIYYRIGRYADAGSVNVAAVAADRAYFAKSQPSPIYRGMYYPHNLDFVWHAASMEGRGAECVRAAREFASEVPAAAVLEMPDMETRRPRRCSRWPASAAGTRCWPSPRPPRRCSTRPRPGATPAAWRSPPRVAAPRPRESWPSSRPCSRACRPTGRSRASSRWPTWCAWPRRRWPARWRLAAETSRRR